MRGALLALSSFVLLVSCAPTERTADARERAEPVVIPAADLEWTDLDPEGVPGVRFATVWGNFGEGAFGAYLRLPPGFASPMHTHTHDMHVMFVSGTYIQQPEGGAEFRLGPGSYLMQPGGDYRHATSCGPEAECIFFISSDGAFDMFVVEQ